MTRVFAAIAAIVVVFAIGAVWAQETSEQSSPAPTTIENPHWLMNPTKLPLWRYYPPEAAIRRVEGRVVLDCVVGLDTRVTCRIRSETPRDMGFGAAALRLAQEFRLSPRKENGQPVATGRLVVPVNFGRHAAARAAR